MEPDETRIQQPGSDCRPGDLLKGFGWSTWVEMPPFVLRLECLNLLPSCIHKPKLIVNRAVEGQINSNSHAPLYDRSCWRFKQKDLFHYREEVPGSILLRISELVSQLI